MGEDEGEAERTPDPAPRHAEPMLWGRRKVPESSANVHS